MCNFIEAWIGKCKNEGDPFCEKHTGKVCKSCGEVATSNCDETMGAFVCGSDLCANCEHEISENGTNGGTFKHCRKDAQKFTPWYERKEKSNAETTTT
jgi:hypothetical protein